MEEKLANPFEVLNERLRRIENLLSNILAENQANSLQKKIPNSAKTVDLAVAITGLKKKTIYNLAYKRLIPHSKRGKRLYFDEAELTEWIRKGKRKTLEELGLTVR
jgi:predicted DNA-binding transcriptional regulator AlpA